MRDGASQQGAVYKSAVTELPFQAFIEALPSLVFVTADAGPNIFVNDRFQQYTGLPRETLTGPGWMDALHPEDATAMYAAWAAAVAVTKPYDVQYRLRSAAGEWRWHLARAVPMAWEGRPAAYWIGTVTDVHDRVIAEDQARASAEQLRLAQEAAGVGSFDWDLIADDLQWSEGCKAAFGLPPDAKVSIERFYALLHPDDRAPTGKIVARATAPEHPDDSYVTEFRCIWPDGTVRWIDARGRVLFTPAGDSRRAVRFVGTVLDVTERKRVVDQLADALATQELLLAEVNHRVKNSLQIVTALLGLHARGLGDSAGRDALHEAQARVSIVAAIHERLYMSGGHSDLDIGTFLQNLLSDTLSSASEAGRVRLSFVAEPDIRLDAARAVSLALVLNELATNSVKYAWGEQGAGRLDVLVRREGRDLVIDFADDGPGLPEDFHLDGSGGLGLRIVNVLVRQLRGGLTILPGKGKGAGFRLVLPLAPA